ncbi:hypothetical protein FDP41_000294 [Naegleria fowleri]|uniref:Uncharacterized protein n=1 Tax=Naegleria fowleri TaxID=5763 RepID=A0A6A5CGJ5_NAEFO|nr:uncharacterized protein FDP41_000294 [Naegleria fowleri]KAF0984395.1 hypothetical protein FDP41_000294 [Naegleria fowleri]
MALLGKSHKKKDKKSKFSKLTSWIERGGSSSEIRKRRIALSNFLFGGEASSDPQGKSGSFLARQIRYWLQSGGLGESLSTTMSTTKTLSSTQPTSTTTTTVTVSFTQTFGGGGAQGESSSEITTNTEQTFSTQEIARLKTLQVFSARTKLVVSALSVWYEVVSYLLAHHKRRIILQDDYFREGGLLDYLKRVKREEGWLALVGFKNAEKDFTASMLMLAASITFETAIRSTIIDRILDSQNTSIPNIVKQAVAVLELPLSLAMTYPFDNAQLVIVKKKIENKTIGTNESDKSLRCIPTLKQMYKERVVYHGFGWHVLETLISNLVRSGLKYFTNWCLKKVVGTQNLEMAKAYLPGDQLFILESTQNICVQIAHEAITAPLHFTMIKYRADMGKTFANPVECFRKIQTKKGFATFYKGVWLGALLHPKRK